MNDIAKHQIQIYDFTEGGQDMDESLQKTMKERIPFGVVGSNYVIEEAGERKRCRQYSWGTVQSKPFYISPVLRTNYFFMAVENMKHCDFQALRSLLIKHHMYDLTHSTHIKHYEKFREEHLFKLGLNGESIIPNNA